jgi:hypothetical protein
MSLEAFVYKIYSFVEFKDGKWIIKQDFPNTFVTDSWGKSFFIKVDPTDVTIVRCSPSQNPSNDTQAKTVDNEASHVPEKPAFSSAYIRLNKKLGVLYIVVGTGGVFTFTDEYRISIPCKIM